MDQIYENASITIIAAADGDTDKGLCGVSMARRSQRRVDVRDASILELPDGPRDVKSSVWASRAWTYQEGYLSIRRLIFTASQVVFLCNGMCAAESLQQLLGITCCTDQTSSFGNIIPKFTIGKRQFPVKHLLQQAEEYSRRDLTRPSDSLNAFLGVLSYYGNNSSSLKSPVLQLPWGLVADKNAENSSFNLRFFWFHHAPATRRVDVPSWSWPGWGGPIEFWGAIILRSEYTDEGDPLSCYDWELADWELSVREVDGVISKMYDLALKEYEARKVKHRLYQPSPKQLLITCPVVSVNFRDFRMTEDQRSHLTEVTIYNTSELIKASRRPISDDVITILEVWNGIYAAVDQDYFKLDQQIQQQDSILGLLYAYKHPHFTCHCCLLVREVGIGQGLYERVGWLNLFQLSLLSILKSVSVVFLNQSGEILDKITISERQRKYLFTDTTKLRTICLV